MVALRFVYDLMASVKGNWNVHRAPSGNPDRSRACPLTPCRSPPRPHYSGTSREREHDNRIQRHVSCPMCFAINVFHAVYFAAHKLVRIAPRGGAAAGGVLFA